MIETQPTALAPPLDECIAKALTALETLPSKTRRTLARHLRARERFEEAERVLRTLDGEADSLAFLLDERAAIAERRGDAAEARALRERRLRLAPDATARSLLAAHLLEREEAEARQRLDDLIAEIGRLDGDSLETTILRMRHAVARDNLGDARRIATHAAADHPRSARVVMHSAEIALLEGDAASARGFLEQALTRSGRLGADARRRFLELAEAAGGPEFAADCDERLPRPPEPTHETLHRELAHALGLGIVPERERSRRDRPDRERRASDAQPVDEVSFDAGSLPPEEQELGQRQEAQIVLGEAVPDERVTDTLRDVFGYDALRPGQATVIGRLLEGADTLAIMPTGAGKSITFQLPSLLIDGLTIVISPLIALMQDQVESMPPRLAAHATFINGTLEPLEMERRMERMAAGDYRLVYVAPERLRHPAFLEALRRAGCARVVIDEAHCISMWGHDFRPDYLYIPHALQLLGDPPVLALTATATPENVHHIGKLLGRRLELVRTSAYRPNLRYEVLRCTGPKEKDAALRAILRQRTGAAIVYVPTRNLAEEVATSLRAAGVTALPYHAGLAGEVRAAHQERFMRGEGSAIVATVAFGMGINKADVRTIVHYAPPKSLEAYIQEAGRAGRDGLPAACVMLVAKGDFVRLRKYANESDVSIEELRAVYRSLRAVAVGRWSIGDRAAFTANEGTGFDPMIGIGLLEQADLVRRHPDTAASFAVRWTERSALHDRRDDSPFERWLARNAAGSAAITVPTASVCAEIGVAPVQLEHLLRTRMGLRVHPQGSAICVELLPEDRHTAQRVNRVLAQLSQVALRQLEAISRYVDGRRCRHVALAAHLGERLDPCGAACDVCAPRPGQADAARQALALETPPVGAHGRASASRRQSPKSAQPSRPVQPSGGPLFEALRAWRLERARQDGMPPYVIAYDRHLEDIARLRPHALNELRQIAGFGQSRIDKYGDEILAVIAREGG